MPLKLITAALLLIAILLLVGHLEYRFAPPERALREEQRSAYLRPCDATVSDRLHYVDATSPRCYFFRDGK